MKKVKLDTIVRTVVLFVAIANQILAIAGKSVLPFTEDEIYQTISITVTTITSLMAWWKNNSFTSAAIEADEIMHDKKNAK